MQWNTGGAVVRQVEEGAWKGNTLYVTLASPYLYLTMWDSPYAISLFFLPIFTWKVFEPHSLWFYDFHISFGCFRHCMTQDSKKDGPNGLCAVISMASRCKKIVQIQVTDQIWNGEEIREQKHIVSHPKKQKNQRKHWEIKTEDFVADNWSCVPSTNLSQVKDLNELFLWTRTCTARWNHCTHMLS